MPEDHSLGREYLALWFAHLTISYGLIVLPLAGRGSADREEGISVGEVRRGRVVAGQQLLGIGSFDRPSADKNFGTKKLAGEEWYLLFIPAAQQGERQPLQVQTLCVPLSQGEQYPTRYKHLCVPFQTVQLRGSVPLFWVYGDW